MQKMANFSPTFLRLPGGNYLEGNTIAQRFQWKQTIGPLTQRPGHESPWGYRSSDGMGLLEFLEWCEDLGIQPVLAVYAGYSLDGEYVAAGAGLDPYVQDALDEIQYVTGDATTTWGAQRAADGHPNPFPLTYVEVGNEDFFDKSNSYDGRFTQFHDAIKAAYPALQLIATTGVTSRTPDVYDDHFYKSPAAFESDTHHYDATSRTGPKVFVGEWASQEGSPTPDMNAALGDAAWLTGLERNSDIVVMEAYAPLQVNVNNGASQWGTNLIGYDALTSYGSPSYYVQSMFAANRGDAILGGALGGVASMYYSATRDTTRNVMYVKVVNAASAAQLLHVTINGVAAVTPSGTAMTLSGASPTDTNTLANPVHIVPSEAGVTNFGPKFDYTFAPYSVTVLAVPITPIQVASLTFNPSTVAGGTSSTGTVTLNGAAPTGGALVSLSSSSSSATVSASVLVAAGQTSATFPVTTHAVTTTTTATIMATYFGVSLTGTLTVTPPVVPVGAHLLWKNVNGQASLWTIRAPGSYTNTLYGPFAGWTAQTLSNGPDGAPHILWTHTSGQASVWNVPATGSYTSHQFGPFAGWTAAAMTTGSDGVTQLLWNQTGGGTSLWTMDTTVGTYTHHEFGPFSGWSAQSLCRGADGQAHLLWVNASGQISLWNVSAGGSYTHREYGPYPGWTPTGVSVGPDNMLRLLWNHTADRQMALWDCDPTFGAFTDVEFGPFAGWMSSALAVGSDSHVQVLWNHAPNGQASIWNVDTSSNYTHAEYGPFPGWTALSITAGP